jgi:hypothetical protein
VSSSEVVRNIPSLVSRSSPEISNELEPREVHSPLALPRHRRAAAATTRRSAAVEHRSDSGARPVGAATPVSSAAGRRATSGSLRAHSAVWRHPSATHHAPDGRRPPRFHYVWHGRTAWWISPAPPPTWLASLVHSFIVPIGNRPATADDLRGRSLEETLLAAPASNSRSHRAAQHGRGTPRKPIRTHHDHSKAQTPGPHTHTDPTTPGEEL